MTVSIGFLLAFVHGVLVFHLVFGYWFLFDFIINLDFHLLIVVLVFLDACRT